MTTCHNCTTDDERVKLRTVRSTGGVSRSMYLCMSCAVDLRRSPGIEKVRWREGHTADDVTVDSNGDRPTLRYDHFKRRGVSADE
jgi:protein-arginine kinase activator protein McsA